MTQIASWDKPELNLELFFCTEVLKLNSLHYGYWEEKEKLNLESIRRAQKRYTETLLEMIPADVHEILDIGCGIGDNARALAERGYRVTAISPDKVHAAYFKDTNPARIQFFNTAIEDFIPNRQFDLVLMSESQGYFAMDMGFSQSMRCLRPGGYLLVSGIFKQDDRSGFRGSHIEDEYIACAQTYGLVKKDYRDITGNTLPTLQYAFDCYNHYLEPLNQTLLHFIGKTGEIKLKLLKTLFATEFRNFEAVRRYYEEHFNPVLFQEKMRYARILFQYEPTENEKELISRRAQKPVVSAIVCAYNEEKSLKDILSVLADCREADEVIVVNDGSSDGTAAIIDAFAGNSKLKIIHFAKNRGKSNAMVAAALRAQGDLLVFLDADLKGLKGDHVQKLTEPLLKDKADMVIGDPQYASEVAKLFDPFRKLSGQRALWRRDFLPLVEEIRNTGFGIETLLNLSYKEQRKRIRYQSLDGLIHPIKLEKEKPIQATRQYLHEGSQIAAALINRAYQREGFSD
ncbi:MAG: glycosyltransferase [Anaerolineae bacterium]|nr:glycosyltransferase [Anaerolineae bacterium]